MSTESTPPVCIGLSFGNSNSTIAYVTNEGKIEVIANQDGDRQIPSILSYTNDEELSGGQAKAQLIRNPSNTVAYFHDFIGKDFKDIDPTFCHASAHPILDGSTIAFNMKEKTSEDAKPVSLDTIVTRHLKSLKSSASDYLGEEVTHVVMTVPTNFNEAQQAALRKISAEAGLTVMQFITEPIAALLASDHLRSEEPAASADKYTVIADYGHTRSDVAVVASRGGIYTVLATLHDYEISGSSFDKVIIDIATKEFLKRNPGASDPRENAKSLAKLQSQCDSTKKALSVRPTAAFAVEALIDNIDFAMNIERNLFERRGLKEFRALADLVGKCIEKAGLDELDVSEVLLIGATSHTPRLAGQLKANLPENITVLDPAASVGVVNPSEASARGAAIQASLIVEFDQHDIDESSSIVVTAAPHTQTAIGVIAGKDKFIPIVQDHTSVPVRKSAIFPAPAEGGDVFIRIVEAKREIKVTVVPTEAGEEVDSDDEPDEEREHVWKVSKTVVETVVRDVKKGGKVELQILVSADSSIQVQAREVGSQGGVRGTVPSAA